MKKKRKYRISSVALGWLVFQLDPNPFYENLPFIHTSRNMGSEQSLKEFVSTTHISLQRAKEK